MELRLISLQNLNPSPPSAYTPPAPWFEYCKGQGVWLETRRHGGDGRVEDALQRLEETGFTCEDPCFFFLARILPGRSHRLSIFPELLDL